MRITLNGRNFAQKELDHFVKKLQLLSQEEQESFALFLDSPYFNSDRELVFLYQRILSGVRRMEEENREEYTIYSQPLLKSMNWEKYSERKIRSDLRALIKRLPTLLTTFLVHHEISSNKKLEGRVRTLALKKKKDTQLFWEAAEYFEHTLQEEPTTIMKYHDSWWLYHQLYFHQYAEQYKDRAKTYLEIAAEHSFRLYQLTSLRYYCEMLNRVGILGQEPALQQIKNRMGSFINLDSPTPLIAIYSQLARLQQFPDNSNLYQQLKANFQDHQHDIKLPDQLAIIKSVFNIWIRHYEAARDHAPDELFFWAKSGVDSGAFLLEGNISDKVYLNTVMASGIAGQFDFLESFIDQYRPYLQEHCRKVAYQMAVIYLHFVKGAMAEAIKLLKKYFAKGKHIEHIYNLRAKIMYVLIYLDYCLQDRPSSGAQPDWEHLFVTECANFRKYIDRADYLDAQRRIPYIRFANSCNQIYKYHYSTSDQQTKAAKAALIESILEEKVLVARYVLVQLARKLKAR